MRRSIRVEYTVVCVGVHVVLVRDSVSLTMRRIDKMQRYTGRERRERERVFQLQKVTFPLGAKKIYIPKLRKLERARERVKKKLIFPFLVLCVCVCV